MPSGVSLGDIKSLFPEAERQKIRSMSCSPAYTTQDNSSLVATITFDGKPASLANISPMADSVPLKSCIPDIINPSLTNLFIDANFLGLTPLNTVDDDACTVE